MQILLASKNITQELVTDNNKQSPVLRTGDGRIYEYDLCSGLACISQIHVYMGNSGDLPAG